MKSSSKAGILIIGIFIGIIAGIAIASWMDYMGYEINPVNKISQYLFKGHNAKNNRLLFSNSADKDENNEFANPLAANTSRNNSDTVGSASPDNPIMNIRREDSLSFSGENNSDFNAQDNIKVASDQLIGSIIVKISGIVKEKNINLDSLLLEDKYTVHTKETLRVELWYSPINYTGYKWSGNKLIVFGFYETDMVKIKFFDGSYYFNYGTLYYLIEPSLNFKNMDLIQEASLIKKLNNL